MNTFCDYHHRICRNLTYQPSGKMRRFLSVLLILRHTYCFSKPYVAAGTLLTEPWLQGLEQRLAFFIFQENDRMNRSPSDKGRISPIIDKAADVQIISELINKHIF